MCVRKVMEATYTQMCKFMMQKSAYLNVLITTFQGLMTIEQHSLYVLLKTDTGHSIMTLSFSMALGFKSLSLNHVLPLGKLKI